MPAVQKHFVTFYSPGTMFPEDTTQPIDSWDAREAFERSRVVTERYGAKPFAFMFTTRGRGDDDLDSKVIATSCRYLMHGHVETLADVEARNDPKEDILLSNMRANNIDRIYVSCTPWKHRTAMRDDDVTLDENGAAK